MKWGKPIATILAGLIITGMSGGVSAADQNQAREPGQPVPRMMCQDRFDGMDTNHDGMVTEEEFMAVPHPGGHSEEVFKSRDANGDGSLSKDEFCAGKGKGRGMGKGTGMGKGAGMGRGPMQ
jgi:Ca2+-binding EF-hand superfamily protein